MIKVYLDKARYITGTGKSLQTLLDEGYIETEPEVLKTAGFRQACIIEENHMDILQRFVKISDKTDLIYYYSTFPEGSITKMNYDFSSRFCMEEFVDYSCMKMLMNKGHVAIDYVGLSQQGCGGIFSCISIAKARVEMGVKENVLCISDDVLPKNCLYDRRKQKMLFSDTISSIEVTKRETEYLLVDIQSMSILNENFFVVVAKVSQIIEKICKNNYIDKSDIENILFPNYWLELWGMVASGLQMQCRYKPCTIETLAHGFSADLISNLTMYKEQNYFTKNRYQIAVAYGYGSHMHCMLFQYLGA